MARYRRYPPETDVWGVGTVAILVLILLVALVALVWQAFA